MRAKAASHHAVEKKHHGKQQRVRLTWAVTRVADVHAGTLGKCLRSVSSLFAFEQQKQEEDRDRNKD